MLSILLTVATENRHRGQTDVYGDSFTEPISPFELSILSRQSMLCTTPSDGKTTATNMESRTPYSTSSPAIATDLTHHMQRAAEHTHSIILTTTAAIDKYKKEHNALIAKQHRLVKIVERKTPNASTSAARKKRKTNNDSDTDTVEEDNQDYLSSLLHHRSAQQEEVNKRLDVLDNQLIPPMKRLLSQLVREKNEYYVAIEQAEHICGLR